MSDPPFVACAGIFQEDIPVFENPATSTTGSLFSPSFRLSTKEISFQGDDSSHPTTRVIQCPDAEGSPDRLLLAAGGYGSPFYLRVFSVSTLPRSSSEEADDDQQQQHDKSDGDDEVLWSFVDDDNGSDVWALGYVPPSSPLSGNGLLFGGSFRRCVGLDLLTGKPVVIGSRKDGHLLPDFFNSGAATLRRFRTVQEWGNRIFCGGEDKGMEDMDDTLLRGMIAELDPEKDFKVRWTSPENTCDTVWDLEADTNHSALFSCSSRSDLLVWDPRIGSSQTTTAALIGRLSQPNHSAPAYPHLFALHFIPEKNLLVVGGSRNLVRIFDVRKIGMEGSSPPPICRFDVQSGYAHDIVRISPSRFAIASNLELSIYEISSGDSDSGDSDGCCSCCCQLVDKHDFPSMVIGAAVLRFDFDDSFDVAEGQKEELDRIAFLCSVLLLPAADEDVAACCRVFVRDHQRKTMTNPKCLHLLPRSMLLEL